MADKIIFLAVIIIVCILAYTLYKNYFGLLICGIGAFLNLLVMAANGWRMPVKIDNAYDYMNIMNNLNHKYIILNDGTRLSFLADVIKINSLIFSLGDIIVSIGIILTIISLLAEIIGFIKEKRAIKPSQFTV